MRNVIVIAAVAAGCVGKLDATSTGTEGGASTGSSGSGSGSSGSGSSGSGSSGSTGSSTSQGGTTSGDTGTGSTTGGGVCEGAMVVSGEGNPLATGNTAMGGTENHLDPSCGAAGVDDALFLWTAAAAGFHRFDTSGSQFDTILALLDSGDCGTELACNDDAAGLQDGASSITGYMAAGEKVAILVDGKVAAGNYRLNVTRLDCPTELMPTPLDGAEIQGNTGSANTRMGGACGGDAFGDEGVVITADAPGFYVIEAEPMAGVDTLALDLIDGISCGPSQTCSTSTTLPSGPARIGRALQAGERVTAVVDGVSGDDIDFTLRVSIEPLGCPPNVLTNAAFMGGPYLFQLPGTYPTLGGSCAGPGYGAAVVGFKADFEGIYGFDLDCGTDVVFYALEGADDCRGAELGCEVANANQSASFSRTLKAGEGVTLVAELPAPVGMETFTCNLNLTVAIP